jgi:Transposase DDE domain
MVAVEGQRWAIEDSFKTAKNKLGLDHNETRSWHGWHRHVSLVMLAFAMMAAIRHRANALPQLPKNDRAQRALEIIPDPAPDPLVGAGNPPHRDTPCATTHRHCSQNRRVSLATRTSSRRTTSPHQDKSATVMLAKLLHQIDLIRTRARVGRFADS